MGQAAIGILMLDTKFPRLLGDIGHTKTWDFPVHMRVVRGASASQVVEHDPRLLLPEFIKAGHQLISQGCSGLTTSCGFLGLMQTELKDALGVPFASSPLMQLPMIEAMLPAGQEAGVLTISEENLTPEHLAACGARTDTAIAGLPRNGVFAEMIFNDKNDIDIEACRNELCCSAARLVGSGSTIGAIVLECTNLAPYAHDIFKATGKPVYSIVSFLNWFQSGLKPHHFRNNQA
ncbi:MAG: aspartate/glutamate racemase family protein [Paracoccaceae bacterium]|jgi:hypothetical protein